MITKVEIDGEIFTPDDYKKAKNQRGSFSEFILKNLDRYDVEEYAKWMFDLIDEDECDCDELKLDELATDDLIDELKERGYFVIKTESISHAMKIEETLKNLNL